MFKIADLERLYPMGTMCVLPESQHPSKFFPGQWSDVARADAKTLKDKSKIPGLFEKHVDDEYECVPSIMWRRTA